MPPEMEMPDIASTLSASFDAADSGSEYVAPDTQEQVADTGSEDQSLETVDASENQAPSDESVIEQVDPSLDPPERWAAADKEAFTALPREAQALVLKRERDVESHLSKRTQELAEQGKQYSSVEQVLAPRRQQLAIEYGSEANALNALFSLSDMATNDPGGFIKYFAEQRGIDLGSFTQPADDASADPAINALRQELAQVKGVLNQSQEQAQQAQRSQLVAQVEAFRNEQDTEGNPAHPHFEDVRDHMAALCNMSADLSLKDAYEQAVWANPETRQKLQDSIAQQSEATRIAEAKAKATAAEKAASTRPRGSNGQFVPTSNKSQQETMSAVYDQLNG